MLLAGLGLGWATAGEGSRFGTRGAKMMGDVPGPAAVWRRKDAV